MNKLLLALAAPLAISATPALASDDYTEGLRAGGTITTCEYLQKGHLDRDFGTYMLREQFNSNSPSQRQLLRKLWGQNAAHICMHAVR